MNTRTKSDAPKAQIMVGTKILRICGLLVFLFPAYIFLTADKSQIASAYHCIAWLYISIVWVAIQTQLVSFRMEQHCDALEQRISTLEKQDGLQSQE
ncbi:MAG: hypothetical protein IT426_16035 [Pirellulales bacterium]|nr:hypothetical protein [Pirellulales bacterium]